MDCLLLGDGILFLVEFKRTKIQRVDHDQVMNYGVNLLEFHEVTQSVSRHSNGAIIVPIIALTEGRCRNPVTWPGLGGHSWDAMATHPVECDGENLGEALTVGLRNRRSSISIAANDWLESPFKPSSTILDATLSLYGNHDVASI